MEPRDDVESITLNKGVIVQCTKCRRVHKVFPFAVVVSDEVAFRRKVDALADSHKPTCTGVFVARCGVKCPSCGNVCIRDQGHGLPGHWCQDSHQW